MPQIILMILAVLGRKCHHYFAKYWKWILFLCFAPPKESETMKLN